LAGGDDARQRRQAGIEQRVLVEQVVAGVGRQAQFGKHRQRCAVGCRALQQRNRLAGVEFRVGDPAARRRHRQPRETVAVQVEELGGLGHGAVSPSSHCEPAHQAAALRRPSSGPA
jgi:hypothetical protein